MGSGKDAIIYVLNGDNMSKFSSSQNAVYQQINGQLAGAEFAKPSYFNVTVYYGAVGDSIKRFPLQRVNLPPRRLLSRRPTSNFPERRQASLSAAQALMESPSSTPTMP